MIYPHKNFDVLSLPV